MKVKTIDIETKTWWDRTNGNTYFANQVTVNYGTDQAQTFYSPFQYGYSSSHFHDIAGKTLENAGVIERPRYSNGGAQALWAYCKENGIILRHHETPAKYKECVEWGTDPDKPTPEDIERRERLVPGGIPRYIRVYDNGGETLDRYTVVFTNKRVNGRFMYLGMSDNPYSPNGAGFRGECESPRMGANVGREVSFQDLPASCKRLVLNEYKDIWGIK